MSKATFTPDWYAGQLARQAPKIRQPAPADSAEKESALHNSILAYCKSRNWICFHGSMAHRAMRTIGEPDFTILADRGRVFFIEAKSRTGKLRPAQIGMALLAELLGHKIHCVRSVTEFIEIVK